MAKCSNCEDTGIDPITGGTCTCSMPETGLPDEQFYDEEPDSENTPGSIAWKGFNDFMVDYQPNEVVQ